MAQVYDFFASALELIRTAIDDKQPNAASAFSNTGASFVTPVFEVHAYSWTDDDQLFNFRWKDVKVSWYKYVGRGMEINREVTPQEARQMLSECLAAVDAFFARPNSNGEYAADQASRTPHE